MYFIFYFCVYIGCVLSPSNKRILDWISTVLTANTLTYGKWQNLTRYRIKTLSPLQTLGPISESACAFLYDLGRLTSLLTGVDKDSARFCAFLYDLGRLISILTGVDKDSARFCAFLYDLGRLISILTGVDKDSARFCSTEFQSLSSTSTRFFCMTVLFLTTSCISSHSSCISSHSSCISSHSSCISSHSSCISSHSSFCLYVNF